jgi:diaminopimelate decarboxylase
VSSCFATYEKPVITKLKNTLMNKFARGGAASQRVRTAIDGARIEELTSQYGSPLFVFSEQALRRKANQIKTAFATRYPNVTCGWSYKTNYLKAICAILHQEGAIAEVVSDMEYEKARNSGVPGDQIVLNGPRKPMSLLRQAMSESAVVNIDHLDEVSDLEEVADDLGRELLVGIRVNLDAGIYPQWSRFGFNVESGQAIDAVRRIHDNGKLRVRGLHCHIGTFILDPSAYARQIEKMVALAHEIEQRHGFKIEYLDIGGGLPSRSKLKGTYQSPDVGVPTIDEYADAICGALHESLAPGEYPQLILESGRAVVDESGYLISSVLASKYLPDGTRAYVMDSGANVLFTSFWYKHHIELDRENKGAEETSVLYGSLCMNIDVVDEGIELPPLERGDRLIFSPVGAYNTTQWMQFIHHRPAVVLIGENGEVDVIREAEDLSDIERRERLPERLADIRLR